MKFLVFDTETTGLPKNFKAPYTDTKNWPNIVQLSWLTSDENGIIKESDNIIKVDFPIPVESSKVHGITNEISTAKGKNLTEVLSKFLSDVQDADALICHNLNFDLPIVQAEILREGLSPEINKKMFCTMRSAVDYCQLPGRYGFKWPKLEELYEICFSEKLENAHDAMIDVKATHRVFAKLYEEKVFQL